MPTVCRVEERRAGREVEGARIPASSAIPPVPRTPLRLRFLSPLIEPSVRISRTGLSFEIMRSHTRSRAVRPLRRSRPLCGQPPGKRTSSRTPPRASDPATDAAAVAPAPVPPTAAPRRPGTRFTSACYVELHITCVMWSAELCGVGQRNPCRATRLAKFAPHNSSARGTRSK